MMLQISEHLCIKIIICVKCYLFDLDRFGIGRSSMVGCSGKSLLLRLTAIG